MTVPKQLDLLWTIIAVLGCFQVAAKADAENRFLDEVLHRIKRFGDDGAFRANYAPPSPPLEVMLAPWNSSDITAVVGFHPPGVSCQSCTEEGVLPPLQMPDKPPVQKQNEQADTDKGRKHILVNKLQNEGNYISKRMLASLNGQLWHITGNGRAQDKASTDQRHYRGNSLIDILQKVTDTVSNTPDITEPGRSQQ